MREASDLSALRAQAAAATAAGSKSFYFATRFFPAELAHSAHAVYWFCRYTDDLVDEAASVAEGRRRLEAWAELVREGLDGHETGHPVLELFRETAARHRIPREYPLELIEGMRMDLNAIRYETFQDLRLFCYRVASVVGLMMSHVIGFQEPAPRYAIDLGIAMQLTNILRDIGEDLERGRVYLPLTEMREFGYPEELLRRRIRNDAFRRLMRFQVERARRYYAQAEPGLALLDSRGRFAVQIAARVYREILAVIEASGYNSFDRRAVVPAWRKRWIAARALACPAMRVSAARLAFWRT